MNKLRQSIYLFTGLCIALLTFIGCSDDDKAGEGNTGVLQLSVGFNSKTITVETKADADTDSCKVLIKNSDGDIIRKFNKVADIPSELWLIAGKYTIEANTGTPKTAEFDKPYYNGKADVTIQANKANKHEITCRLSQSKVSVVYGKNLNSYYSTYSTTVSMGTTKLEFKKDSTKIGYFYAPDGDKDLVCKVTAKNNQSEDITSEYTIKNIKPYTHYIVNVDINNSDDGGLKFTIEVDETADEKNDNVDVNIKKYPTIKGESNGNEFTNFTFKEDQQNSTYTLKATAAFGLQEFTITNPFFQNHIGTGSVNLMNLLPAELNNLKAAGMFFAPDSPTKGITELSVTIPANISIEGVIGQTDNFTVSITDTHGQNRSKPFSITIIPDMDVFTDWQEGDVDAWAAHAYLRGKWISDTQPNDITINYKKRSDNNWITIPTGYITFNASSKTFYAKVNYPASEDNTAYEYTVSTGGKTSLPQIFTSEKAMQIPNSNFNTWTDSDHSPFTSSSQWWDTANGGTKLLSTYPTLAERTDIKEGEAAAKLMSLGIMLGNKLAAGNIYTGKFDKIYTAGGISNAGATLYFGKPYTNRPSRLAGWYKYTSGVVNKHANSKYIPANNQDIGSIQIALCYWPSKPEGHLVNTTKEETFIDYSKNNPEIIAYGSLPDSEISTTMSDYKKFDIELKYRDLSKRPTHIVIIGASSKYGDYFCGSENSVLLLDDFQLVFDNNIIEDL